MRRRERDKGDFYPIRWREGYCLTSTFSFPLPEGDKLSPSNQKEGGLGFSLSTRPSVINNGLQYSNLLDPPLCKDPLLCKVQDRSVGLWQSLRPPISVSSICDTTGSCPPPVIPCRISTHVCPPISLLRSFSLSVYIVLRISLHILLHGDIPSYVRLHAQSPRTLDVEDRVPQRYLLRL